MLGRGYESWLATNSFDTSSLVSNFAENWLKLNLVTYVK